MHAFFMAFTTTKFYMHHTQVYASVTFAIYVYTNKKTSVEGGGL